MLSVTLTAALLTPAAGPDPKEVAALIDKAAAFLATRQADDGSFVPKAGPGITALVAASLIRAGRGPDDPVVARALKYLEKNVKPDGGIYSKGLANYTTSVAVMAFKEANSNGRYDLVIANAAKFLKSLQSGDESGDQDDPKYGGVGYDGKGRPDLSNTAFFLDALRAAGVGQDDPAVKKALVFVSRCQNLKSEHNDQPFAAKASADDKGGFVYVQEPGKGKDDALPDGGLRSAGSMTYAGLKSFLYAGVSKDDERVKAAVDWIRRHYTLDENPGQGQKGLYYYYHLFAKAFDAPREDEFADAQGVKHDWRNDLFAALKKRQKADGSWVNPNPAFFENTPELTTAFSVLSLSYTLPNKR